MPSNTFSTALSQILIVQARPGLGFSKQATRGFEAPIAAPLVDRDRDPPTAPTKKNARQSLRQQCSALLHRIEVPRASGHVVYFAQILRHVN
jgi:hypothetical protein